jgi:hypothetical protein
MNENNQPYAGNQYALENEKRKRKSLMYSAIALGVLALAYFLTKKK